MVLFCQQAIDVFCNTSEVENISHRGFKRWRVNKDVHRNLGSSMMPLQWNAVINVKRLEPQDINEGRGSRSWS